jgi:hypothetical protein
MTAPPHNSDAHGLAVSLEPALRESCADRLGPIEWFRCSWQHGGAATGFSTWTISPSRTVPVFVKLPVGPIEHRWTSDLGGSGPDGWDSDHSKALPTPRTLATGTQLGGYDLAWIVTERFPGDPLSMALCEDSLRLMVEALADFHADALSRSSPGSPPADIDYESRIAQARERARGGALAEPQRWNEAIHAVQRALPRVLRHWRIREINTWCHGDFHAGNAMRRAQPDGTRCVLIDLALVHAGHWVEDAVYLERQFWGHPDLIGGLKPVSALSRLRRERGLPIDPHATDVANAKRVLMASVVPLFAASEGNIRYTHAALETIERLLPQIK